MNDRDAATTTEMSKRPWEADGGTVDGPSIRASSVPADRGQSGDKASLLMDEVLRRENLIAAYKRVIRNGGAPGVDGVTVDNLQALPREHFTRTWEALRNGTYRPQPVRRVDIPKPGGKGTRTLGIPTVMDRLIQQALLQKLQPIFDPTFSEGSFGFRPGRSTHQAVFAARAHIAAGYRFVVDVDLEKFFDRVNHDVLMARVARRIKDQQVLRVIRRFLQAGMMDGGLVSPRSEGTPQGGPLSPLLSNVLLDELDKELERRGHRFARYADDCNVYVRSEAAGERVMASLERFLTKRLRLKINREKSAVARPWNRKFLGYSVTPHHKTKLRVAPTSVKRLKANLCELLRRGRGRNLSTVMRELRPVIRGWVAYFQWSEGKGVFEDLDKWIRHKLRCIVWRQWKRPRTRFRELSRRGIDATRAATSAFNGRGPWWNAGASHMNQAMPTKTLTLMGLTSFTHEHQRLARSS